MHSSSRARLVFLPLHNFVTGILGQFHGILTSPCTGVKAQPRKTLKNAPNNYLYCQGTAEQ
jgi:hypothetical protein